MQLGNSTPLKDYPVSDYPTTFLIGSDGMIKSKNLDTSKLEAAITKELEM